MNRRRWKELTIMENKLINGLGGMRMDERGKKEPSKRGKQMDY